MELALPGDVHVDLNIRVLVVSLTGAGTVKSDNKRAAKKYKHQS
jgi:hypothetical protein